jgi:hypothetical protein
MQKEIPKEDWETAIHFAQYAGQWVVVVDGRVAAAGKTIEELDEDIAKKNVKGFAYHRVPPLDGYIVFPIREA